MACDHDKTEPTDWIEFRLWQDGRARWDSDACAAVLTQVAEQLLSDLSESASAPQEIMAARDLVRRVLNDLGVGRLALHLENAPAGEALQ